MRKVAYRSAFCGRMVQGRAKQVEGRAGGEATTAKDRYTEAANHRAVTRSVTKKRSTRAVPPSGREDPGNQSGGIRRVQEGMSRRKRVERLKMKGRDGDSEAEEIDFCPDKFHGSFSSSVVQEIVSTFGARKISLLNRIGFNGLIHLKPGLTHSRHLVFWLYKKLDASQMVINMPDGSKIQLDLESVQKVLGIRCTGSNVVSNHGKVVECAKSRLQERFQTGQSDVLPDLDYLRRIICKDYGEEMTVHEEETFMIALAAFVCAYMFGPPKRTAEVPRDMWEFISDPANLLNCNWGAYVLSVIQTCARGVQMNLSNNPTSIKLGGCWLYLEVFTHFFTLIRNLVMY